MTMPRNDPAEKGRRNASKTARIFGQRKISDVIRLGTKSLINPPPAPNSTTAPSLGGKYPAIALYHSSYIFLRKVFSWTICRRKYVVRGSSMSRPFVSGCANHFWSILALDKLDSPGCKYHHLQQQPAVLPPLNISRTVGALTIANGYVC